MDSRTESEFFDKVITTVNKGDGVSNDVGLQFSQLNLSRPFLRAIESMGYVNPTPIQAQVLPYAMAGRDICASAITGSGKTAAFTLPFLERLLYKPKNDNAIRVLVVSPTRELATQSYEVLLKLAQFTDVSCALICGGKKDIKSQEAQLRNQPDVVICTPGRMLDHLRNSRSVTVDDLDVLVLDEVDRLLDMGFQEEVEELVKYCPVARQTMLFSATMTPRVEDLIKLSLKRPVRIKATESVNSFAPRLVQEFIRVRRQEDTEAIILSLIKRGFGNKTIVFFEKKSSAHHFTAILKLNEVSVCELHGDLPQAQRYAALETFRDQKADVMIATDVAARGLDVPGVHTVINAEMPKTTSTYIHRVGRTARAGSSGRAITLVTDDRRKLVKLLLKGGNTAAASEGSGMLALSSDSVLSRTVPSQVIAQFQQKIDGLEDAIEDLFDREKALQRLDKLERDAEKAENIIQFHEEISARPARTWYQSEYQKKATKEKGKEMFENDYYDTGSSNSNELIHKANFTKLDTSKFATKADAKAAAYALSDSYPIDPTDKKSRKLLGDRSRMTRKKRRRLEAMEQAEEAGADETEREAQEAKAHRESKLIVLRDYSL